ncbi:hypothetical protein D6T69_06815 [Tenacibaculum singaporense]|uniref:SmpA/OmlA family protein n=1 Tax=Tenacibaculum singaporense TaxID=2358479 RepID=A0A3Q8RMZ2_9FLAO|nr:hypothetical protein [Tenacibaculum singaporense]AZJ35245.1 hypothetical protein D6T69_06815 [Tenacibaculum singaporense]
MKKTFLAVVLILSLYGCATTSLVDHNKQQIEKARKIWVGETKKTLILNLGKPYETYSDGSDGEVYSYRKYNGFITWVTNYYINNEGIIYHLNANSIR